MGQTSSSTSDSTSSQSPSPLDQSCPPTPHDLYSNEIQVYHSEKNGSMGGGSSPDFPPSDGYRWRKYGQKSVKGSAFARNYYKCTYPGCTVKKQVEKMNSNGKLVDHVSYKGEHTHDPPQITRLNAPDQQTFRNSVINESLAHTEHIKREEDRHIPLHQPALMPPPSMYEPHLPPAHQSMYSGHHPSEKEMHSLLPHAPPHSVPPHPYSHMPALMSPIPPPLPPQHSHALVPYSPPMHPVPPPTPNASSAASPRLVIETNTDVDHLDDGYHWRKYGQKTVKGSPYPRSYYKCTEKGCSVKKQVEQNGNSIVNTYEGTHTHLAPALDETTGDGKRRRPRRSKDSLELAQTKKRLPDEIEISSEDIDHRLTPDQQKRIRMQSMVEELTSHDRINTSSVPELMPNPHQTHLPVNHHSSHSSSTPVLPHINRQLMEPVPSSSMMHPSSMQMGHHHTPQGISNYYPPPTMYPPPPSQSGSSGSSGSGSGSGRLSHSIEMPSIHHSDDMFQPFTLPPPNRHPNM